MTLEIITPEKEMYNGTVTSVKVPGSSGEFEILNNHASIVSSLINGNIRVINDKQEELNFNIKAGVIEMQKNKIVILAE
jgi:F-type H+-transporting ATPase subunit epsilon|tara:strand:+ start:13260 stop:13496 length:237 start_codon:yes stop_codon:yes gene_type:complete